MYKPPTEQQLAALPRLYSSEVAIPDLGDKIIAMHFFIGSADWYAVEYDPSERLFWGFVNLGDDQNAEWGYFSLDELMDLKFGPFELDFDQHWIPVPARQVGNICRCPLGIS
jgi:hypothetical protein